MGYKTASELREALALDQALYYHFQYNHYPPLPTVLVEPAKKAIELARDGQWDETVSLEGTGVEHRRYGTDVPARECIEGWHLHAWLEN